MSGPDFRHAIAEWAPVYMKGTWGLRLLESIGSLFNAMAVQVDIGRRAGNPLLCEEDALPYHARDRQIELYATEPPDSKRRRTSRWWQLHQRQGTHLGQMANLQPYFLPGTLPKIRAVHSDAAYLTSTWWTMNQDGTVERYVKTPANWNWDGNNVSAGSRWARSWFIIYTEGTALDTSCAVYDDGTVYDDGVTVYDGVSAQARADLIRMLVSWRSAHEQVWGVALAHDPDSFDPTATATTLGDGTTTLPNGNWLHSIDSATNAATRLQTADWIYDRTRDGA